jgi:hypothetical protein
MNIRKRIGNDLLVSFDVRTNGELLPLEGRSLVLELVHEYGERTRVPFSVSGSMVSFHFRGREQRRTGCYYMTLWENLGSDGQAVVDTCEGFTLVPKSCQESDGGADGLEVESLDLGTVDLAVGVKGDSAYDTWLKDGHEGTEDDFLAWLREPAADAAEQAVEIAKQAAEAAVRLVQENVLGLEFDDTTGAVSVVLGSDDTPFVDGSIQDDGTVNLNFDY